jgi:hypothetical protein
MTFQRKIYSYKFDRNGEFKKNIFIVNLKILLLNKLMDIYAQLTSRIHFIIFSTLITGWRRVFRDGINFPGAHSENAAHPVPYYTVPISLPVPA